MLEVGCHRVVVVLDVVVVVGLVFWAGAREGVQGVGFVGEVVLVEAERGEGLGGGVRLLVGDLVVVVVGGGRGVVVVGWDWWGVVGEELHAGLGQVILVELEEGGGGGSVAVGRSPPGRWRGSL